MSSAQVKIRTFVDRFSKKKVALVHEFLVQYGGAERVLEAIAALFPNAPIHTLVYDPNRFGYSLSNRDIKTSFLQRLPFGVAQYKKYLALMPKAIESFNLRDYDLIISDSSSFAKGVITHAPTIHICYCHTPTRFIWQEKAYYIRTTGLSPFIQPIVSAVLSSMKRWDFQAAQRPDVMIANSKTVSERIRRSYQRSSIVIHPFVNAELFSPSKKKGNYYLMGGRLVPYKRYDIVIEAFNRLPEKLIVVGDGYGRTQLEQMVQTGNITFVGRVPDERLRTLYNEAKAYIFPAEEDFGITPLEAMVSGVPVVAYGRGGATETVVDGKTGLFFDTQTPDSVLEALGRFPKKRFEPRAIRRHALSFSKEYFMLELAKVIEQAMHRKDKT